MEAATADTRINEALYVVGQYLSDSIAPVQAVDSVSILIKEPAQLMASEIMGWIAAQAQVSNSSASVADYLFHAVSKLRYLAHLQLIPEDDLTSYLASLKDLLLQHCPPQDRELLRENLDRLGEYGKAEAAPVSFMHRLVRSSEPEEHQPEKSISEQSRMRRRAILKDRLAVAQKGTPFSDDVNRQEMIPLLIASAASDVHNSEEFRRLQEDLQSLGIHSGTEQIFRALGQSLPGWAIIDGAEDAMKSSNPAVRAMCRIIYLAEDRREGNKRFQDMVQAAIEQFNTGSLARAATIFDLALSMGSDDRLDADFVTGLRRTAHKLLDLGRMRSLAKKREKHRLLRKVLSFFEEFAVENLLEQLKNEERRERRRFLLDLLIVHGEVARGEALERLRELASRTSLATDWYFARNLIYLLNEIPRRDDSSIQEEIKLVAPLMRLSLAVPLLKEVIRFAGQTKCSEAEELLISTADKLEKLMLDTSAGKKPEQKLLLLDRAIFALAHFGTQRAHKKVIEHGISCREELGDTVARLAYLAGQNLSSDNESLALLVQFLREKMPRKLFGFTISKNEEMLVCAIKALSSTPTPIVCETFQHLATKFPNTRFGQAAAEALKDLETSAGHLAPADRLLTGDLELFALPDLLQQLVQLQATGTLILKDARGNQVGTMSLIAGRLQSCSAGFLEGREAVYQLIEKPIAGTFIFQGQKGSGVPPSLEAESCLDLEPLVVEGMRRYDELERARAIVPDFAFLRRSSREEVPRFDDAEAALVEIIWPKTINGTSPEECEASCRSDSYQVRTLLARLVEQGALVVE